MSLTLKTSPVTLKEMVMAYGTIANDGHFIWPWKEPSGNTGFDRFWNVISDHTFELAPQTIQTRAS